MGVAIWTGLVFRGWRDRRVILRRGWAKRWSISWAV